MYQDDKQQSVFQDPRFFQGAKLNPNNRWVIAGSLIPWDKVEEKYKKSFSKKNGRPAKPVRMAIGSYLIKEKYDLSDVETVEMIKENPYLQFFLGLPAFEDKAPFEASMMTWFRKRITPEMIVEVNEYLVQNARKKNDNSGKGSGGNSKENTGEERDSEEEQDNKGTMIVDATCIPSDIRFPTDVSLISEAREKAEGIIDELHKRTNSGEKKPRTYRRVARTEYLRFARNRKPSKEAIRKITKKQLSYLRRDLKYIKNIGKEWLTEKESTLLTTLETLYEQQREMHESRSHQIPNRIVSIHSPWVRPIVRGKANAMVEFGAKVAISVVDGFSFVEKTSWNAYNESNTLKETLEKYRQREGCYPKRVLADKIYRTRENRNFCKLHGIKMSGPKLGRPPKDKKVYREQCLMEKAEAGERNTVEGVFGTGKRSYSMNQLTSHRKDSCEAEIYMLFLSLNLWKAVKVFHVHLFRWLFGMSNAMHTAR